MYSCFKSNKFTHVKKRLKLYSLIREFINNFWKFLLLLLLKANIEKTSDIKNKKKKNRE